MSQRVTSGLRPFAACRAWERPPWSGTFRPMRHLLRSIALGTVVFALAGGAPAHEGGGGEPTVGDLGFADPAAAGISYEWTLRLHRGQRAEMVHAVGAKSWHEPSNPEGLKGWTHTANWIAVELEDAAVVKVTAIRQQGVVVPSGATFAAARAALVPALSLYRGWDDTTAVEDHTFNSVGNFWATIEYMGSAPNPRARPQVAFRARLAPGRYSIAVGGNPRSLGDPSAYPANGCDPADATCYAYTGLHGYRLVIQAK